MVSDCCCICNKHSKSGIVMFAVPTNELKRKKWNDACGKTFKDCCKVCQLHFQEDDLKNINYAKKVCLRSNAVPSLDISKLIPSTSSDSTQFINEEIYDAKMCVATHETSEMGDDAVTLDNKNHTSTSVQTGQPKTHMCGLVEMALEDKVFNLNCFYCTEQFLICNWKNFVTHIQGNHSDMNQDFGNSDSLFHESTNLEEPTGTSLYAKVVCEHIEMEPNAPKLKTELIKGEIEKDVLVEIEAEKTVEPISNDDELCVNTPISNSADSQSSDDDVEKKEAGDSSKVKNSNQISIWNTDSNIVMYFLEIVKDNPLLWHKSYPNRSALSLLTEKVNGKWNLSITNSQMTKSLYAIKKWYRNMAISKSKQSLSDENKKEYFKKCSELQDITRQLVSPCDICKRSFFGKMQLQIHMFKSHRVGELPFKCSHCNYGFADEEKAKAHELTHEKVRSFICTTCGQGFFYEKLLKTHMLVHTDDYKRICESCGKVLMSVESYRKHKRTHRRKQE